MMIKELQEIREALDFAAFASPNFRIVKKASDAIIKLDKIINSLREKDDAN